MGGWNKGKRTYSQEEIVKLYTAGNSTTQIAQKLGTEASVIRQYLLEAGVKLRSISEAKHLRQGGHINADKNGYHKINVGIRKRKKLHRYIMEQHLGRTLSKDEIVHHIDGNKHNNSIENLVVMTNAEHSRLHRLEYWRMKNGTDLSR